MDYQYPVIHVHVIIKPDDHGTFTVTFQEKGPPYHVLTTNRDLSYGQAREWMDHILKVNPEYVLVSVHDEFGERVARAKKLEEDGDPLFLLYMQENNGTRYIFREIGMEIAKKYGLNSKKMINRKNLIFFNSFKLHAAWHSDIDQLIELGVLRGYTSRGSRTYKGRRVSGVDYGFWVGLTDKGWEMFIKDAKKHGYLKEVVQHV